MKKTFIALGIAGALVFTGCAGKKHKIEDVPVTVQPNENPAEQLDQLTAQFEKAKAAELPLLAPTWFAQAQDSYEEALQLRNESKDTEELYRKIDEARIELRHANEVAVTSQKVLATALGARKEAVAAVQTAAK